jgi:hypothetical protein
MLSWTKRVSEYFSNTFVVVPELVEGAKKLNELCKWILDLLRNAVVVGALQYFADKSNSQVMKITAVIGLCALFGYCISYTRVAIRPFHFLKNQKLGLFLDIWTDKIFFWTISLGVVLAVQVAVYQIAVVQIR